MLPPLIAIAAMTPTGVIGHEGKLPWHFPEELKWFKKATLGHAVIMGRRTYDSILARIGMPLPGRLSYVFTRGAPPPEPRESVHFIRDLAEIPPQPHDQPAFVIGGAEIYSFTLPWCSELWLTEIHHDIAGDTWFPEFRDDFAFHEVLLETSDFTVRRYVRTRPAHFPAPA